MSINFGAHSEVWWDRSLFLSPETSDRSCPEVMDVTGKARILVFGPYGRLDPGYWRATVSFELCDEGARRSLAVQFGTIEGFTTVDVPYGRFGRRDVEISRFIKLDDYVEIRMSLKAPAFHGSMRFLGARLERVLAEAPGCSEVSSLAAVESTQ